jgi:mycoredoxin
MGGTGSILAAGRDTAREAVWTTPHQPFRRKHDRTGGVGTGVRGMMPLTITIPRERGTAPLSSDLVTMYSTVWCGYCRRLKDQMDREGIAYQVIDIEDDPEAADLVMAVNGGNQTVPTLVFPDGSALTNPSLAQIKQQLAA